MNKKRKHKPKRKRNKKYSGAAAQSARDKQKELNNYQKAEDYLSNYRSTIKLFNEKINLISPSDINVDIIKDFSSLLDQSAFNKFKNLLPSIDSHGHSNPLLRVSRQATLAYSELANWNNIKKITAGDGNQLIDWYKAPGITGDVLNSKRNEVNLITPKFLSTKHDFDSISAINFQADLSKATEYSIYTEKSLSSYPWSEVGSIVKISDITRMNLSASFLELTSDYSKFIESFNDNPKTFVEISPALRKTTPVEFYTGVNFLESISTAKEFSIKEEKLKKEIQYENEYTLKQYLPIINPGLYNMWKGAIETFNSDNSDKIRQFTVSLRELFGHIMHILAPDEAIAKWSNDPTHYHDGKPTRKARLHYICRNISNKPFNKFVEKDIQATIEFIAIFQDGTHSIESNFSTQQLIAIKSKAETTLKFIIEIEFSTNR